MKTLHEHFKNNHHPIDFLILFLFVSLFLLDFFQSQNLAILSSPFVVIEIGFFLLLAAAYYAFILFGDSRVIYVVFLLVVADLNTPVFGWVYRGFKWGLEFRALAMILTFVVLGILAWGIYWGLKLLHPFKMRLILFTFVSVAILSQPFVRLVHRPDARPSLPSPQSNSPTARNPRDHGNFYYFILDAHAGLGGFPADIPEAQKMREEIEESYRTHGFTLFSRAYSNYYSTAYSVPSYLNASLSRSDLTQDSEAGTSLTRNAVFSSILAQGYEAQIYQTDFLDYCNSIALAPPRCHTYPLHAFENFERTSLRLPKKVVILLSRFLDSSIRADSLASRLKESLELRIIRGNKVTAINAFAMVQDLKRDLPKYRANTFVFAHILLPHNPFAFTAACGIQPDLIWKTGTNRRGFNHAASRHQNYLRYVEQVQCVQKQMTEIFDLLKKEGLFDSSTILIHADHGSRITLKPPLLSTMKDFSGQDFRDCYVAFFAFKPGEFRSSFPLPTDAWESREMSLAQILAGIFALPIKDDLSPIYVKDGERNLPFPIRGFTADQTPSARR